jgi:hypothetical protein
VVVGTVRLLTAVPVQTLLHFKKVGVEFLLLPPVTVGTPVLKRAAVLERGYEVLGMPVRTHLLRVGKDRGLASIVLPIVSVHADVTLVVILTVGTPNRLEVEEIEVHIGLKFLYQLNRELLFAMCEGTEFSIIALGLSIQVRGAKLGLILVRVVKLLDPVVSTVAALIMRALLMTIYIAALLRLVYPQSPPAVLLKIVIVRTLLEVVG